MSPNRPAQPENPRWLSAKQHRAWLAYLRVQLRMNYEMNRQLQTDSGLSLADYDVLNALGRTPDGRLQVSYLVALIGWERSRVSHHIRRLTERGLVERTPSAQDGRATDAVMTTAGRRAVAEAAPGHVALVRRLFFDSLPDDLLPCFTAALEHIHVSA